MRVATVCFSGTVGGLELATLRRGAELRERGHQVIAVLPDSPDLIRRAEEMGLPVDVITPALPYLDLSAARKLNIVLQREEIDLLLVARTRDLSTAEIAAGRDIAVVLYQQMQSGLDKHDWFHNKVFRRLDGCVTITRRGRDEMAANTALAPEKICVIPYGLDTARFSPDAIDRNEARAAFGLPADAFTVGIVGGFNPGKGQREFLRALGIAAEREPGLRERLHALLVGERPGDAGDYVAELHALRAALPFADRVRMLPFADDPRVAYGALDIFVLASHSETFGMVVQEAMAMEVAVVATNAGGVPEIVTDGETGLLVEPGSPEAIAEAILRLYREPDLRGALADKGRRFIIEAYDFERQYAAFERALEEALARRREA